MSKAEYPVTQAVRFLRSKKIDFVPYVYAYEEHGGTARFAECTGKPEHQVIKTIVLQDEHKKRFGCFNARRQAYFHPQFGA